MITAKVIFPPLPKPLVMTPMAPLAKAKVTIQESDYSKPPTLPESPQHPQSIALLDMEDVDGSTLSSGAILFWEEATSKFVIQKYDPNKISDQVLDGGTF